MSSQMLVPTKHKHKRARSKKPEPRKKSQRHFSVIWDEQYRECFSWCFCLFLELLQPLRLISSTTIPMFTMDSMISTVLQWIQQQNAGSGKFGSFEWNKCCPQFQARQHGNNNCPGGPHLNGLPFRVHKYWWSELLLHQCSWAQPWPSARSLPCCSGEEEGGGGDDLQG